MAKLRLLKTYAHVDDRNWNLWRRHLPHGAADADGAAADVAS
jgi:hypothetical protein